jgi:hypothetical protein
MAPVLAASATKTAPANVVATSLIETFSCLFIGSSRHQGLPSKDGADGLHR